MRTLYMDCRSGASGDMMLGAFIDLGVPEKVLRNGLQSLGLNEFALEIKKKEKNGLQATDVDVILFDKERAWIHPYSGVYRNYGEIKSMIDHSGISVKAKSLSKQIFDIKATAESEVHGVPVDKVQFHEVGAVDSIVDIVGTAICFAYLDIDRVACSQVSTGYGTVKCACGELPVPAPAVKAILEQKGIPHYRSEVKQELLTPTGAAIIAGLTDDFLSSWEVENVKQRGFGTGKRETGLPPLCLMINETTL